MSNVTDISGRVSYPSEAARIIGELRLMLVGTDAGRECEKALIALAVHNPDVKMTDEEMIAILRGKGYEVTRPKVTEKDEYEESRNICG